MLRKYHSYIKKTPCVFALLKHQIIYFNTLVVFYNKRIIVYLNLALKSNDGKYSFWHKKKYASLRLPSSLQHQIQISWRVPIKGGQYLYQRTIPCILYLRSLTMCNSDCFQWTRHQCVSYSQGML